MRSAGSKGCFFAAYCTSIGWGGVVASDAGLMEIILPFGKRTRAELMEEIHSRLPFAVESGGSADKAALLLSAYFNGERVTFDLQLDMTRFTPFQQKVYASVIDIPYGVIRSYGEVAISIGRPAAARSVGAAMAANPLPVIIPCHRVVGTSGSLCGYSAAGGIDSKKWLLRMEGENSGIPDLQLLS
jgi:methylated-DNA-[protein]-cysteine S-methyltransferase